MKRLLNHSVYRWDPEEEEVLDTLTGNITNNRWKKISKEFNKRFESFSRTPRECWERWNLLKGEQWSPTYWSKKEQLCLMLGIWKFGSFNEIAKFVRSRTVTEIQKGFYESLRKCLWKIYIGGEVENKGFELLWTFFYSELVIQCLENKENPHGWMLFQVDITEDTLLKYIRQIAKQVKLPEIWTRESLREYVEDAMEKLENELLAEGAKEEYSRDVIDDTLDGVLHRRLEEPDREIFVERPIFINQPEILLMLDFVLP